MAPKRTGEYLKCEICGKEIYVSKCRLKSFRCCSKECFGKILSVIYNKKVKSKCNNCNKDIDVKANEIIKLKHHYCSFKCMSEHRKSIYIGENNPNYRAKYTDNYGYVIDTRTRGEYLHKSVCFEILNIDKVPKGYHIHHRDCNLNNNAPDNLALLEISDHKWLHKQFGSAVLNAYFRGCVRLEDLCNWSNDYEKSKRLLTININLQIVKDGKVESKN